MSDRSQVIAVRRSCSARPCAASRVPCLGWAIAVQLQCTLLLCVTLPHLATPVPPTSRLVSPRSRRPGEQVEVTGIYVHYFSRAMNVQAGFPVFTTVIEVNNVVKQQDRFSGEIGNWYTLDWRRGDRSLRCRSACAVAYGGAHGVLVLQSRCRN